MSIKRFSTNHPGIVYYEHKTRKHNGKPDRRFLLRYRFNGKQHEEALGWASQDWNVFRASEEMASLKRNQRTGKGPVTIKEKRLIAGEKKTADKVKKDLEIKSQITFSKIFTKYYFPQAKTEKVFKSHDRERSLFDNWIDEVIGNLPMKDIAPIHLEKIKKNMRDAEKADRSIQYCLAVVRQVFNFAFRNDLYNGENPIKKIKMPKINNKRLRFLTLEEADTLLDALKNEVPEVWEQALISLHTGLRASEVFNLKWVDVDTVQEQLTVKDSKKNDRTRFAYMTDEVKEMLLNKETGKPSDLLYLTPDGDKRKEISTAFRRIVSDLGFNDGIEDRRDKVVFHTLRHTYASWLVQSGEPLYNVKELMGHSIIQMTERYSHLAPKNKKDSVKSLQKFMKQKAAKVISLKK